MRIETKYTKINIGGFTMFEFIIMLVILIIIILFIPKTTMFQNNSVSSQQANLIEIQKAIDHYYVNRGRYPKNLTDLLQTTHPYFIDIPIDPFTGRADWEVAEKTDITKWYRTSNEAYPNAPIKWSPTSYSSIFIIRPRR